MMFIHALWVNPGVTADKFDSINPLTAAGEIMQRHGWKNPITVMVFDGFEQLGPVYLNRLRELGYGLVDYSERAKELYATYTGIAHLPINEFKCFLRWIAIEDWLKDQGITEQVFVLDADIVFNADPAEIAQDMKGLTTILQGNPCFTSITDYTWFAQYREALNQLNADLDGFSRTAWNFKQDNLAQILSRKTTHWLGNYGRQIISSDMELIAYLLQSGQLPQSNTADFVPRLEFYYAENALFLMENASLHYGRSKGFRFSVENGQAVIDGKKLAFWHLQGGVRTWLNLVYLLRGLGYKGRVPMHDRNYLANRFALLNNFILHLTRRDLIHRIEEFGFDFPGRRMKLEQIFCDDTYWEAGVFLPSRSHS